MSFLLSEEMVQFRDSLRKMWGDAISSEIRRFRLADEESLHEPSVMQTIKESDLFSLWSSPEAAVEVGITALFVVAVEAGYALVPESVVDYLFYGPYLLSLLEEPTFAELRERVEDGKALISGTHVPFIGKARPVGGSKAAQKRSTRLKEAFGILPTHFLTGSLSFVEGVEGSDFFVVPLETGELFLVWTQEGVEFTPLRPVDESLRAAELKLRNACAVYIPQAESLTLAARRGLLAAGEMYGAASRSLDMTIDYAKSRTQFGSPIGSFQAVQQGMAEAYLQCEALFSLLQFASWAVDKDPSQASAASRGAVLHAEETMGRVCEKSIQYHGGIGFTWEYDLHLFFRRVKFREMLFGLSDEEMDTFVSSLQEALR